MARCRRNAAYISRHLRQHIELIYRVDTFKRLDFVAPNEANSLR